MAKALIINTPGLYSTGGMAVVMSAVKCLRENIPTADITILCHRYTDDWRNLEEMFRGDSRIKIKKHPWFREHDSNLVIVLHSALPAMFCLLQCIWGRVAQKLALTFRNMFQEYDVILDLNIDALNDHYNIFYPTWALTNELLSIIAGKPVIIWGASIGIFEKRLTRFMAKYVLNKLDIIIAREHVTRKYLETMGVKSSKIHVTADHAFLLDPAPPQRLHEILSQENIINGKRPLIGVSASQIIHRYAFPDILPEVEKYKKLIEIMASSIDYLVDKLNAEVILIPHSIAAFEDDRIVSREICMQVQRQNNVKLINGNYRADETKAIVGICDMFIGCRMHATIASTSMHIPTIAVVYGHKSHGIIGDMMGQGKYLIEVKRYSRDELLNEIITKIDGVWANRDSIIKDLKERTLAVRKKAMLNYSLIKKFLKEK